MTTPLSTSRETDCQVEELVEIARPHHASRTLVAAVRVSVEADDHDTVARVDVAVACTFADPNRANGSAEAATILTVRAAFYTVFPT
jgi:hypothetical protein